MAGRGTRSSTPHRLKTLHHLIPDGQRERGFPLPVGRTFNPVDPLLGDRTHARDAVMRNDGLHKRRRPAIEGPQDDRFRLAAQVRNLPAQFRKEARQGSVMLGEYQHDKWEEIPLRHNLPDRRGARQSPPLTPVSQDFPRVGIVNADFVS